MSGDEHDEFLSSLAARRQISPEDLARLKEHLSRCASCRAAYSDMRDLLYEGTSAGDVKHKSQGRFLNLLSRRNRYKERFVAKAREHGIHFSEQAARSHTLFEDWVFPLLPQNYKFALVTLLLLVSLGMLGYWLQESRTRNAAMASEKAELTSQNVELRQRITALSETKSSLEDALARTRTAHSVALARASELKKQLEIFSSQIDTLGTRLNLTDTREEELQNKLREAEGVVAQLTDELQQLRLSQRADAATISAQQSQINELSQILREHTERLDRAQRLLAVDRDIHDLMAARNLHITDVFDVDGKGKSKRPFGRIFYTEGKSLIFYAFDLESEKFSEAKHSFQAWGYQEPASQSARSLGIFYVDEKEAKRWVLKFDDPNVLQEIDAIFVTVEPYGGGRKATGQKLLYAYLRNKPNHP